MKDRINLLVERLDKPEDQKFADDYSHKRICWFAMASKEVVEQLAAKLEKLEAGNDSLKLTAEDFVVDFKEMVPKFSRVT